VNPDGCHFCIDSSVFTGNFEYPFAYLLNPKIIKLLCNCRFLLDFFWEAEENLFDHEDKMSKRERLSIAVDRLCIHLHSYFDIMAFPSTAVTGISGRVAFASPGVGVKATI